MTFSNIATITAVTTAATATATNAAATIAIKCLSDTIRSSTPIRRSISISNGHAQRMWRGFAQLLQAMVVPMMRIVQSCTGLNAVEAFGIP